MGGKHPSKFALLLEGIKITPTTSRITLGNYTPIDNIVTTDTRNYYLCKWFTEYT